MSRPVKAMLRRELVSRLQGVDSLAVLSLTGVDGVSNNRLRRELRAKDIRVTVVKNSVARQALAEVGLGDVSELLDGPCAFVTGGESVVCIVRELLEQRKEIPSLVLKGALMESEVFGPERMDELGRYPTRDEALAARVGQLQSPGAGLVAALVGAGSRLAGIIQAIKDRAEDAQNN